jgi:hypothetical protein
MNTHEIRNKVVQLIGEGVTLNPADLEHFYQWVESSYRTLEPFSFSQRQFDECCRSSTDSLCTRAYAGLHLLKLTAERLSGAIFGESAEPK